MIKKDFDKDLFHETFSCLHASDTIYEEVLEMAENNKKQKKHYIPKKMAVACAFAVAASGITVFAAAKGGFFQSAFGSKGHTNIEAHPVTDDGQSWMAPSRDWEEVDEDAAAKLTGGQVVQIGDSVSVYGYTLTIDEYMIDENGIGAVTYTLSNPDGLEGISFSEYGDYYVTPDCPMSEISMWSTSEKMFDTRSITDQTKTTETELHAVLYFAPFEKLEEEEGILIRHSGYEWDENGEILSHEQEDITFIPDEFITSSAYTNEAGYTAHVSPIGILIDGPVFEMKKPEWIHDKLIITYTDGSVYQAANTDVLNEILSCYNDDGALLAVFNRLVDTDKISSITVNGPDGADLVFTAKP